MDFFFFSRKFSGTFLEFPPKKHGFWKSPREAVEPFNKGEFYLVCGAMKWGVAEPQLHPF